MLGRAILIVAVVAGTLLAAKPAEGYDPRYTHRWLTRQAAELLVAQYPGRYDELLAYLDEVAEGALHEDDPILDGDDDPTTMRVMRHFFHGADGRGLTYDGRQFPSSLEWVTREGEHNAWNWHAGLAAYERGDRAEAYFVLGHVVHLIQDLTVPAHAHLDAHGPPSGDDYESYCTSQMIDQYTSRLPLPAPGTPIPHFANLHDAWWATARASYWRNMYPGDLGDPELARGLIAQMFPSLAWSWFSDTWTISSPPIGALGKGFWEEEPGWFYFEIARHPAAVDILEYLPYTPAASQFGPNAEGLTMVEGFARDLIPIAILHSAAVMKLYLDEAYALETHLEEEPPPLAEPSAGCAAATPALALAPLVLILVVLVVRRNPCAR